MGLPYELALELPLGELLDLIAIDRVQRGEMTLKSSAEDNGDFWDLFERK